MAEEKKFETPQKTAVAVAYEPGEAAPKILATGKGEVAERIIAKAKEDAKQLMARSPIAPSNYDPVVEAIIKEYKQSE